MSILAMASFDDFKNSHCFTILNQYHQYCLLNHNLSVSFNLFQALLVEVKPLHSMSFSLCAELIWIRDLKSLNFSLPSFGSNYLSNSFINLFIYLRFFYFIQQSFLLFFNSECLLKFHSADLAYLMRISHRFQHLESYEILFHQDYCCLNDLELPPLVLLQSSIL